VDGLYGGWEGNPDFGDFFGDVSYKKSVRQKAVSWEELMEILAECWDQEKEEFNLKHPIFKTEEGVVQGAAFKCTSLQEATQTLKTHYGIVSVASGFAWSAIGINIQGFLQELMLSDHPTLQHLPLAALTAIWPVYEEMGLGGVDEKVIAFHQMMGAYSTWGKLQEDRIPDFWWDLYCDTAIEGDDNFLQACWVELLRSKDLKEDLICSNEVWDCILLFAHLRGLGLKITKGNPLTKYQKEEQMLGLTPEHLKFLACAIQIVRDGAKGRLHTETNIGGCIKTLEKTEEFDILRTLYEGGIPMHITCWTLVEMVDILSSWNKARYALNQMS
jgi:hypothetical protein